MIDTIVLTLNESMFAIIDHNRFSPSTAGLYSSGMGSYDLGGRSNMVCKQNPTRSELRMGFYKPRLSVTKRATRLGIERMLKIEFSAPKMRFGNNFDELIESDFDAVVDKLQETLENMGVKITRENIERAPVSSIHYSKNIPLTDYTIPYTYLKQLAKTNINLHLDTNRTDFRNEGHSFKYRSSSFEIVFYDKLKDLRQAKTSEKRAEERDNALQLNLIDLIEGKRPFEVLRFEVRLNRKQKIRQVFRKISYEREPTFQSVFKQSVAKDVLQHYIQEIKNGLPALLLLTDDKANKSFNDIRVSNPHLKLNKLLAMFGLQQILKEIGIREFREITKSYGKDAWYTLNKEMRRLKLKENPNNLSLIDTNLADFTPLRLVDFDK